MIHLRFLFCWILSQACRFSKVTDSVDTQSWQLIHLFLESYSYSVASLPSAHNTHPSNWIQKGFLHLHEVMCFISSYPYIFRVGCSKQHIQNIFMFGITITLYIHASSRFCYMQMTKEKWRVFFVSFCLLHLHLIQFVSVGHLYKDWRLSGATTSHSDCTYCHLYCWNSSLTVWSCSNYHHITSI